MGRNNYFQFKKFRINQEKSAMKVNTDGVLLGAWTDLTSVNTVLDIGTGTGMISLMIAQRSAATITGIEIEKNAAEEAYINVQHSVWNERIKIEHVSFQDFADHSNDRFDLIVSNPPFFSNSAKNREPHVAIARHNHKLPFSDILSGSLKLLAESGKLALILPADSAGGFIEEAQQNNLFLARLTEVQPFPGKEPNRYLMEFGRELKKVQKNRISVYNETGKDYSEDFKLLARDFYLKL